MTDWVAWHRDYDDPDSSLLRRLVVVRRRLAEALEMASAPTPRLLSLCAGDGRDVVPILAKRTTTAAPVRAVLVERDETLAARAAAAAAASGLDVDVRCADAADPRAFEDHLPVDVLLLCGIFGNLADTEVEAVIASLPPLLTSKGLVLWTRGRAEPDPRPQVRVWFRSAGFDEVAFDGAPETYGVGLGVLRPGADRSPRRLPTPWFTFTR